MPDRWKLWVDQGKDWQAIYDSLEPDLAAFSARNRMRISPWRWEEPSITLSWLKEGYHRSIRMLIGGEPSTYYVDISGSVWRDIIEGDNRSREYKHIKDIQRISVGSAPLNTKLKKSVQASLEKAHGIVSSISECPERVSLGKVQS